MGIYDRDYMQRGRGLAGVWSAGRVTWWIIGINAGLWILYSIAFNNRSRTLPPDDLFTFLTLEMLLHPREVVGSLKLWQLFTAFWMHLPSGAGHVFWNMLALFFFGRSVEGWLGRRRYLWLYLGGGFTSTVVFTLWSYATGQFMPALGASGAVFAVLVWMAAREPNRTVYLMFFLPMPMWLAVGVLMVGVEMLTLGTQGKQAGGAVGHLAGAAWGYFFFRWLQHRLAVSGPGGWLVRLRRKRRKGAPGGGEGPPADDEGDVRHRVDTLLERISREGIQALSEEEKRFLQEASKRYR